MLDKLPLFKLIFFGILTEAFPFILLGAFISSLIHAHVSERTIQKYLPKHPAIGILVASMMGLVFPLCECAIVPIVRRLMKKGVPVYLMMPFMVSVPIINPIVIFSTIVAFNGAIEFAWLRVGMGMLIAWILGFLIYLSKINNNEVLLTTQSETVTCGCGVDTIQVVSLELSPPKKRYPMRQLLRHTSAELYDIGKYLIVGAFISALFKTFIPQQWIVLLSDNPFLAIVFMMLFAFVLSLCSEVDAFIARTFVDVLPQGALLSFLVLGPMSDIKNFMMLCSAFKRQFVIRLTAMIFGLVFFLSLIFTMVKGW